MNQVTIHHVLGEVVVKPAARVNPSRLRRLIREALDHYDENEQVPASVVHDDARARYGNDYQTPGYFLRLYRQRAELTQAQLAAKLNMRQHHLSEMERNKRTIGKAAAQRLAGVLDCDYRRLL